MKFNVEEARDFTIECISKMIGEDKIKLIIEDIRNNAKKGYFYININCADYDIVNKSSYLIGFWAEFNGYKVSYPRAGVVNIDWKNIK